MNMNYSYSTTRYESILVQMYVFLVLFTIFALYHEKVLAKIIFLPELCTFGRKYFHELSRITVVQIHVNVHPACHSDANGIKPGSTQK